MHPSIHYFIHLFIQSVKLNRIIHDLSIKFHPSTTLCISSLHSIYKYPSSIHYMYTCTSYIYMYMYSSNVSIQSSSIYIVCHLTCPSIHFILTLFHSSIISIHLSIQYIHLFILSSICPFVQLFSHYSISRFLIFKHLTPNR